MTHHCIVRKTDDKVLVRAPADKVQPLEGNWYIHPDYIDKTLFEISERVYHCPKKGICQWVDMKTERSYVNDVSWVYDQTQPDFDRIAGWYGFYGDHTRYYHKECD